MSRVRSKKVAAQLQTLARGINLECGCGDQFRLIKASLPALGLVERHRDDGDRALVEKACLSKEDSKSNDCFRQHSSQHVGCRAHPVELQQVNQFAQAAVVAAVSHCPVKRTIDAAANRDIAAHRQSRVSAKDESTRSPQTEQIFPRIGLIPETQSRHTGRREMFSSGSPQIRQSEGNRTEKRPSAALRTQVR